MKYHLGLLDADPTQNRTYQWVRRRGWFGPGFPDDVREELGIWFAMPGFTDAYHIRNLNMSARLLYKCQDQLPGYDHYAKQVAENWLSVTREDAVKLCRMRQGTRACPIPLISQLKILDDIKAGMTQAQISRDFGCTPRAIYTIRHKGLQWAGSLPEGFELLRGFRG